MKIYFVASISGRKKYKSNYSMIVDKLKAMDHEVVEHALDPKEEWVYSLSDSEKQKFYEKVVTTINKSDLVIAEASYPSLGVGYEIAQSLDRGTPVVVLYSEGDASHFLQGIKSDKLLIVKYDKDSLGQVLNDSIDYASEQMDTRFNFFISPKIANYLDWIARKKRVPRAVYLRRLIENDMKSEKFEQN